MISLFPPAQLPPFQILGEYVFLRNLRELHYLPGVRNVIVQQESDPPIEITTFGSLPQFVPGRKRLKVRVAYTTGSGLEAELELHSAGENLYSLMAVEIAHSVPGASKPYNVAAKLTPEGLISIATQPKPDLVVNLFPEEEEEQNTMPAATQKVTGKQAAMLRARAHEAGLHNDKAFLEWLEYESKLDINAEAVEEIEAIFVTDILAALGKRG
jgi:hypothetical protein